MPSFRDWWKEGQVYLAVVVKDVVVETQKRAPQPRSISKPVELLVAHPHMEQHLSHPKDKGVEVCCSVLLSQEVVV